MKGPDEERRRRRLQELLTRGDVGVHPQPGGAAYLFRPRQLFVPKGRDSERAVPVLEKLGASRQDEWSECDQGSHRHAARVDQPRRMVDQTMPDSFEWERWFVPPTVDVPAAVDYFRYAYRDSDEPPPAVSPNHVVLGHSWAGGEPADDPEPADEKLLGTGKPFEGGEGIVVAVLDTGIDAEADEKHQAFSGHFVADQSDIDIEDADHDGFLDTQAGHGTFVAGVALTRAPAANFEPVAVLDSTGVGDDLSVSIGIEAVGDRYKGLERTLIVNLSLGAFTESNQGLPLTHQAIRALGPEALVLAAAGNFASSDPFFPAVYKQVVGVGAVDADMRRAFFSNYGWWVDACSYGTKQVSTYVKGTFRYPDGHTATFDAPFMATWSGTSFATPNVAGAVAARASRGFSVREAYEQLWAEGPAVPSLGKFIF
jgi:subtilisin family serine protease